MRRMTLREAALARMMHQETSPTQGARGALGLRGQWSFKLLFSIALIRSTCSSTPSDHGETGKRPTSSAKRAQTSWSLRAERSKHSLGLGGGAGPPAERPTNSTTGTKWSHLRMARSIPRST